MVSKGAGRSGSRWRRAQAQCMADGASNLTPCYFCGQPIDYVLTKMYPRHRMAGTAHHIVGLHQGGDPLDSANLSPAHFCCNARDGAHRRQHPERYQQSPVRQQPVRSSRRW
ncbi:MAG: hypothetical protein ACRDRO_11655 [Pseudonocardiaceae bacterium]